MVTLRLDGGGDEMTTTPDAPTLLFIHGFLDDASVWDDVIAALAGKVNTVSYDLPGFGTRALSVTDPTSLSLESLAAEAGEILSGIDTPVIVVGQSLGTQVAELVAAQHADRVDGLVLLTPVPLGGTRLPDEVVAPFRASGGDLDAQRAARTGLSPDLTVQQLDRLIRIGGLALPNVVARYVDVWNNGVEDPPAVSAYTGPVLVVRGGADAFVTAELVATISPRFPQADVRVVDRGGHWLHVEYPTEVATMLLTFIETIGDSTMSADWRRGFAQQSHTAFADQFADHIVLDASTLARPIEGKQRVAAILAAASSIYESLEFTAQAHDASASYLQWRATAFGGIAIRGVTVLERDANGKIVAAAIHHRPLGAVLRFSAEIRDRLAGVIPADHFLGAGQSS